MAMKQRKRAGVQDARHTHDPLPGQAAHLFGHVAHGVQGVADDDQEGVGRFRHDFLGHRGHDVLIGIDQIFPAHPRFPGDAGGDDDDLGVFGGGVVIGPHHLGVKAEDRARLHQVQGFALGHAFHHIHQHHIAQLPGGSPMGTRSPHVARSDNGNLRATHNLPPHEMLLGRKDMGSPGLPGNTICQPFFINPFTFILQ